MERHSRVEQVMCATNIESVLQRRTHSNESSATLAESDLHVEQAGRRFNAWRTCRAGCRNPICKRKLGR
jgi:hypothetical protein